MAEWLFEAGIGEHRAALVEDGVITEAAIELPGTLRLGTIARARLLDEGRVNRWIQQSSSERVVTFNGGLARHAEVLRLLQRTMQPPVSSAKMVQNVRRWLPLGLSLTALVLAGTPRRRCLPATKSYCICMAVTAQIGLCCRGASAWSPSAPGTGVCAHARSRPCPARPCFTIDRIVMSPAVQPIRAGAAAGCPGPPPPPRLPS